MRAVRLLLVSCLVASLPACSPDADPAKSAAAKAPAAPVSIERWGPQSTPAGVGFNEQPGGGSGVWIEARNVAPDAGTRLLLGDAPLERVTVTPTMITAAVPAALLQHAGARDLVIVEASGRRTVVGTFKVLGPNDAVAAAAPASTPQVPIKIERWGPQSTPAGVLFNEQPGGKAGVWIEATGVPAGASTRLLFGGTPLDSLTITEKLVTAAVPAALLQSPGTRELVIESSRGKTVVGTFTIEAAPGAAK